MSRIHEALKKAEREQAASPRPKGTGEHPEPEPIVPRLTDPVWEAAKVALPPVGHREQSPAELTFQALTERCPQPRWKPDPRTMLLFNAQNSARGTEEFRTLRSRLERLRAQQPLRTVLITSSLPKEGKTFVAANLAQAIGRQKEKRVLLIDGDLRAPQLHIALGAPLTPGLSDYLRGDADEFAIMQRSPHGNLLFVPGGKPASHPAELIANGRLKNLLNRLGPLFDWLILDSPPIVPVSDAGLLADICDGVLMIVRAGVTPFDLAQKASHEFRSKRLLGVVLNGVEPRASYSSYYYDHYLSKANDGKGKS